MYGGIVFLLFRHKINSSDFENILYTSSTNIFFSKKYFFVVHKLNYLDLKFKCFQPLEKIVEIVRQKEKLFERKIFIHTDAAQVIGKINVDVNKIKVDFLTIAGHKVILFCIVCFYNIVLQKKLFTKYHISVNML